MYFDVSSPVHVCLPVCCTFTVNDSTDDMCSAAFSGPTLPLGEVQEHCLRLLASCHDVPSSPPEYVSA